MLRRVASNAVEWDDLVRMHPIYCILRSSEQGFSTIDALLKHFSYFRWDVQCLAIYNNDICPFCNNKIWPNSKKMFAKVG